MKYTHFIQSHGDGIAQTLHKLRQQYGDNWTDNMATYAISKTRRLPWVTWREPAAAGQKYIKRQYV